MSRDTITKRTIADRIAEGHDLGQVQTQQVIQAFLDEIVEELAKGNRLEFRDFGVFETVVRKPRTALNPKTLEKVQVKSRAVVRFKVGRVLKEKVAPLVAVAGSTSGTPLRGQAPDRPGSGQGNLPAGALCMPHGVRRPGPGMSL